MATISIRMADELKRKAKKLAKEYGVSLTAFVNASIAAAVAQKETLTFFDRQLEDIDEGVLEKRVQNLMKQSRSGDGPTPDEINRAIRR